MKDYTFDVTLAASFTLEAESEDEARMIIEGILSDCSFIRAAEHLEDIEIDYISGEATAHGQPELVQIDGKDIPGE